MGLTVPDIRATCSFFIDVLGFEQVGEKPVYPAVFVSDGEVMITLWQARDPERARPFDRANTIGLHHLALRVAGAAALDALFGVLDERGDVRIDFAPEPLGNGGARHMMCFIPGGVRLELIAVPA